MIRKIDMGEIHEIDDDGEIVSTEALTGYAVETREDLEALFAEFGLATTDAE